MSEPQPVKSAAPPPPRRRPAVRPAGAPAPANLNSVGQTLKVIREERPQSVEEIADILKIRRIYLQAIEDSNWAELPELVYAQGFVRSYADYLGQDGAAVAAQFKREFRGGPRMPELEMPKPIEDNQVPNFKIIAGVVGGLFVLFVLWGITHPSQRAEPTPPAPTETQATPAPALQSPVTPAQPATVMVTSPQQPVVVAAPAATPEAAAPAPQHPPQTGIAYGSETPTRVTITAAQDSWVQVRAGDGQIIFSRVMRPGDYYRVPGDAGLTLTTGNLSGLNFDIDNQNVTPQGAPGTVLRNVPLAPESLSQGLAALNKADATQ